MNILAAGLGLFWASFLLALSGAVVPGPLFVGVIDQTARRGFWASPVMIAGHLLAEVVVVALMGSGLMAPVDHRATRLGMAWAGGGALAVFGAVLLAQAGSPRTTLDLQRADRVAGTAFPLGLGLLLTVANPYWFVWWATIGAGYLAVMPRSWAAAGWFFAGHAFGDLAWYAFVGLLVVRGVRSLSRTGYRWLLGICGVFLLALAAWFFRFAIAGPMRFPL